MKFCYFYFISLTLFLSWIRHLKVETYIHFNHHDIQLSLWPRQKVIFMTEFFFLCIWLGTSISGVVFKYLRAGLGKRNSKRNLIAFVLQKHIFKGFSPLEPRLHNMMNISCRELSMFFNNTTSEPLSSNVSLLCLKSFHVWLKNCHNRLWFVKFQHTQLFSLWRPLNDAVKKLLGWRCEPD